MPAVTGPPQLLTLQKMEHYWIREWPWTKKRKWVEMRSGGSEGVSMCKCSTVDLQILGYICETKRWVEPDRVSVFMLLNAAQWRCLCEPRLKQRASASGLDVDTPNQPLRTSAWFKRQTNTMWLCVQLADNMQFSAHICTATVSSSRLWSLRHNCAMAQS